MEVIAEDNQLLLPLLGLLLERPRSARELTGEFGSGARFEHLSQDADTIHSFVQLLREAGWVTSVPIQDETVDQLCTITPAGREELKRRLGEALLNTSWTAGHQFVAALPHLQLFDRDEAVALLDQRATALRQRARDYQAAAQTRVRTYTETAKDDYLMARMQAEIGWIEAYRDRVTATPWPPVDLPDPTPTGS